MNDLERKIEEIVADTTHDWQFASSGKPVVAWASEERKDAIKQFGAEVVGPVLKRCDALLTTAAHEAPITNAGSYRDTRDTCRTLLHAMEDKSTKDLCPTHGRKYRKGCFVCERMKS